MYNKAVAIMPQHPESRRVMESVPFVSARPPQKYSRPKMTRVMYLSGCGG